MKFGFIPLALLLPVFASAQGLQAYIPSIATFVYQVLIPFLIGVAFLIVVINIVRYFVISSTNPDGREKAKAYLLYSILAFVLIFTFIGLVLMLAQATNLGNTPIESDYRIQFGGP